MSTEADFVQQAMSAAERSLRIKSGQVSEARCARYLQSHLANFVHGAEGSNIDAGILVNFKHEPDPTEDRLLWALDCQKKGESCGTIVSIEFKTVLPCLGKLWRNGRSYYYGICWQEGQGRCDLFVVSNPADESIVALIPRHLLLTKNFSKDRSTSSKKKGYTWSREVLFFGGTVEPFPPEWVPFVMPLRSLPQALQLYVGFASGEYSSWSNPYNHVELATCPPHRLLSLDPLLPDPMFRQESSLVQSLIHGFRKAFPNKYRVDRPHLRPSVGDVYVTRLPSGEKYTVEIKQAAWRMTGESELRHVNVTHPLSLTGSQRGNEYIFTSWALWDFLFSISHREKGGAKALFLSRHEVPPDWFTSANAIEVRQRFSNKFLSDHTIPLPIDERFIRRLARRLDMYSMLDPAPRVRPMVSVPEPLPLELDALDPVVGEGQGADSPNLESTKVTRHTRPASGPRRPQYSSPRMWRVVEGELLHRMCCKWKQYGVYNLSHHPSASHIFTLGHSKSLAHLHPGTPVIYLNFAPISFICRQPFDARRPWGLYHATHGRSPSLFVLNAVREFDAAPHGYFLVPSEALSTEKRRKLNQDRIAALGTNVKLPRIHTQIDFKNEEPIYAYRVQRDKLIDALSRILRLPLDTKDCFLGDEKTGLGTVIDLASYVTTVSDCFKQMIDIKPGKHFWQVGSSGEVEEDVTDEEDGY